MHPMQLARLTCIDDINWQENWFSVFLLFHMQLPFICYMSILNYVYSRVYLVCTWVIYSFSDSIINSYQGRFNLCF